MDFRTCGTDSPASRPSRKPHRGVARAGVLAIAGTFALTGTAASVAGAASASRSTAHRSTASRSTEKSSGTPTLASLESELTSLEKPPSSKTSLLETGSSLFYPLVSAWASAYGKANSSVSITTASTGSGAGQSDALNGTVQIGASDAYLPPSDPTNLLDIPEDVSAQQIDYNVNGISASHVHLKLSATLLVSIYDGKITKWNDPAIAKLNPGVKLPSETIVPIHRSDGSGDTFIFTQYLAYQDPSGWVQSAGGPATSVQWPSVSSALAEKGNQGMESTCKATPGCIAYIGVSYLREAVKNGLAYAELLNGSDNFVLPTPTNIANEVASFKKIPTTGAISLVDSKVAKYGYPIANFEYAIVNDDQPSSTTAQAIKAFLAWGMDPRDGSSPTYLAPVYFQSLAPNAMQVAIDLVKKIH